MGWVKGGILGTTSAAGAERFDEAEDGEGEENEEGKAAEEDVFATRACLDALAPVLFADPRDLWARDPASSSFSVSTADKIALWQARTAYHLAVLNLWYLLCASPDLRARYDIRGVEGGWGVVGGFVRGLKGGGGELRGEIREGEGEGEGEEGLEAMLGLLDGMVEMVIEGMRRAGMGVGMDEAGGEGGLADGV